MSHGINLNYYKGVQSKHLQELRVEHILEKYIKKPEEIEGIPHNSEKAWEPVLITKEEKPTDPIKTDA